MMTMGIWSWVIRGLVQGRRYTITNGAPRFEQLEGRLLLSADIQGTVFLDTNGNGVQDGAETGIPGWIVSLNDSQTATTDANGNYLFSGLSAGTYKVSEALVSGFSQTYPILTDTI